MTHLSHSEPDFADRREAGRQLAQALEEHAQADPLVLALPRGGVPVAVEVAKALRAQLDLLFVRKLGAPGFPEYAIGAVVDGHDPQVVFNKEAIREIHPAVHYVEAETKRQLAEIEHRRARYLDGRQALSTQNRMVIIVDDGIATGSTVRVALKALRRSGAASTVLAVPVAPADVIDALRPEADEIVCLRTPEEFLAVGVYYADFGQVSDEEVIRLIEEARAFLHNTQD